MNTFCLAKVFSAVLKVQLDSVMLKKACFCALLLCLAISAVLLIGDYLASQPLVVTAQQTERNVRGEVTLNGELFTGELINYDTNGRIVDRTHYVSGHRDGLSRSWFKNGVLGFEAEYVDGRKNGLIRSWWENGNLRTQEYRKNSRREGEGLSWYPSGALFKKTNHEAGRVTGLQQIWRENGKISSNFEYRNGRRYGLFKSIPCMGVEDETPSLSYYNEQS
jgi:antitoxin component YwqK of YwqJK toxin-antitoxin module